MNLVGVTAALKIFIPLAALSSVSTFPLMFTVSSINKTTEGGDAEIGERVQEKAGIESVGRFSFKSELAMSSDQGGKTVSGNSVGRKEGSQNVVSYITFIKNLYEIIGANVGVDKDKNVSGIEKIEVTSPERRLSI